MTSTAADGESTPRVWFEKTSEDVLTRGLVRGSLEVFSDERTHPPPVGTGEDKYPTPVDYFLSSLVGCQMSVLAQCLAKARIDEFRIEADADIGDQFDPDLPEELPQKFVITDIDVNLSLTVPPEHEALARRCLEVYDQGCIVGQSIRAGVEYETTAELSVTEE